MSIKFFVDESATVSSQVEDPRDALLAGWLRADVGDTPLFCLDALAMIDDINTERAEHQEYEGNAFAVYFSQERVKVANIHVDDLWEDYTLAHVQEEVERYWNFQKTIPASPNVVRQYRPDLSRQDGDLLRWEDTWQRRHPYRGRLGIPETGPA